MRRSVPWIVVITLLSLLLASADAPARAATAPVSVLAHGFGAPDDLAWGPHGSIYFSDFGNSSLNRLDPNGHRSVVRAHLAEPEGIVVKPDGSLVVAEQGPNRLLHLDLVHHTTHALATIPNPGGQAGIDGIAYDPRDGSLVVPDSPSGRVLRISGSGRIQTIATGLGRPVGALAMPNGSIVVVDEHLNGAFRIDRSGAVRRIGGFLRVPDDIVGDGHAGFYVTCLGDGTLRHISGSGITTLVAANLRSPQGLLRQSDGTLIVTQETDNLIVAVHP
jgi:sugar lactone lactonase YvrE